MTNGDESPPDEISDPRRIRALAHPLRLQLLGLLGDEDLTASECAELTGESPASCSFHLRTLAKYGYIVRGEQRGREKPWQLVSRDRSVRPDYADPASVHAVGAMATITIEQQAGYVRAWAEQISQETPDWVDSSTLTTSATWATREELAEISDTLQHIADRFRQRNADPTLRPADARPVQIFGGAIVDVAREHQAARLRSEP